MLHLVLLTHHKFGMAEVGREAPLLRIENCKSTYALATRLMHCQCSHTDILLGVMSPALYLMHPGFSKDMAS